MARPVFAYGRTASGVSSVPVFEYPEAEFTEDHEDNIGICLSCGETQGGCEPDARRYQCESCRESKVYGLDEALLMGRIHLT